MSGFYAEQTETVDLGKGNSATLRRLTYGEISELLSACRVAGGEIDYVRYTRGLVEKGVIGWTGPGFEGREVKVENIRALPAKVGSKLASAAIALNKDIEDDEGNESGGATNSA